MLRRVLAAVIALLVSTPAAAQTTCTVRSPCVRTIAAKVPAWHAYVRIAVTANEVIIGTPENIVAVPKSGGPSRVLVSRGYAFMPMPFAIDGGILYWADVSSINSVPIAGGQPTVQVMTTELVSQVGVASGSLVWIEGDRMLKVRRPSGAVATLITTSPPSVTFANWQFSQMTVAQMQAATWIPEFALDSGHVSWLTTTSTSVYQASLADLRVASVSVIPSANVGMGHLMTDGARLLFYDYGPGTVVVNPKPVVSFIPISGGACQTLPTDAGLACPHDAVRGYCLDYASDTIYSVPLMGGGKHTLVSAHDPRAVAIDAASVYYAEVHPSTNTADIIRVWPKS